jgi:hypothetical protein
MFEGEELRRNNKGKASRALNIPLIVRAEKGYEVDKR